MPINTDARFIGRAWITPDGPVVAGELGTWTITYEVGAYGYDERARLKIACRFASDWGKPQFTEPGGGQLRDGPARVPQPDHRRASELGAARLHPPLVQVPGRLDPRWIALSGRQGARHPRGSERRRGRVARPDLPRAWL